MLGEAVSGRHRPHGRRSLSGLLSVVGVALLVGLTAFAVRIMSADAEGCSADGIKLTVATSPEIAPAVVDAAKRWGDTRPDVNGKCIRVEVRPVASADVASMMAVRVGGRVDVAASPAPTPSDSDIPAVWMPDSTAWLNRVVAVDRGAIVGDSASIAMSPVVLAIPEAVARPLLGTAGTGATPAVMAALLTKLKAKQLKLAVVEPRRDTAGLAGAMLLKDLIVTGEDKLPELVFVYRGIGKLPNQDALTKAFGQGLHMSTMSEQAVLAHNTASEQPLAAIPLLAGAAALDYPYAAIGGKPREIEQAAIKFRAALLEGTYFDAFATRGFRAPDGTARPGFPTGHGVTADPATAAALTDPGVVRNALALWSAAIEPSRTLALLDVTSSMGQFVAPGITKLNVLQTASIQGGQLFADASELGLWTYGAGHTEIVPIGRLSQAHRNQLNGAIAATRVGATDECALYETLLEAYKKIKAEYDPNVTNRIVIFIDGRNTKPGMSLGILQRELEKQADVTKPVEVTLIGVGPGVDKKELDAIAQATGSREAFQVLDPRDIGSIFVKALLS